MALRRSWREKTLTTPILLSPADAAHLVRRPLGTVKRWACEGRLTSHGGRYDWLELAPVAQGECTVPPRRCTTSR